ncbi:MAG: T9SS type A sorting domain-containing protein, partial [Reichenbachiella sp.]
NTIRFTANGSSGLPNLDEMTVCQGGEDLVLLPTIALSAVESNGSIVLNWTVSDGVVNSQQVYRDTDSDPSGRVRIAQAINGSNYTDATAEEGTTYYYWIKASAAIDGSSVNSNSADATIPVVIVNYTLSTVVNGQGSVTPNGGMFEEGTSVTLIATPASGWQFDSWSGGFTGTSATVVMDSDKSVTANFLQIVNQVTISIQEDASGFCGVDGSVDSNNSGFTGAGFANTSNASGNGIEYSISASAGSATLVIQYANGSSDRPANIIINGSQQGSALSFASTGSWSTWSSVTTTVTLNEGVNSIRLEATVSGGLGNIDYIELSGNNVSGASCSSSARLSTVPSSAIAVSAINVQVYPNPVVDRLSISTEGTIDKVEVYNMIGSLVNRVEVQFNSIDISQLHAGQYILKVFTPEGTSVHRVIKQ